jgi:hypothetical protein
MSRPNVELLQSDELAGEPLTFDGWPLGATVRVLSLDDETGALTALISLPEGYRRPAGAIEADSELFVVSGAVRIGGEVREHGWYDYSPAGSRQEPWRVAERCDVLLFARSGTPSFMPAAHRPCERSADAIELDAAMMRWTAAKVPNEAPGAAFKILRHLPETGEFMILASFTPHWRSGAARVFHDGPEEGFFLGGEMSNGLGGTMRKGSYFWHAPYEGHGPHDSDPGGMVITWVDRFVVNHVAPSATSTAEEHRAQAAQETPAGEHADLFVPPLEV